MLGFLLFVLGVLLVGGLLFLGASMLLGRGETQPPAELDRSPVELPDDRPVTSDDVRSLRISVAFRGYRMTEVDWLLDQFALILDERDAEIAALREQDGAPQEDPHPHGAAGLKTLQSPASPDDDVDPREARPGDADPTDEETPHA